MRKGQENTHGNHSFSRKAIDPTATIANLPTSMETWVGRKKGEKRGGKSFEAVARRGLRKDGGAAFWRKISCFPTKIFLPCHLTKMGWNPAFWRKCKIWHILQFISNISRFFLSCKLYQCVYYCEKKFRTNTTWRLFFKGKPIFPGKLAYSLLWDNCYL